VPSPHTYFRRDEIIFSSRSCETYSLTLRRNSTIFRRDVVLQSLVLIRGNFYKLVHYETLQIVAAVWRTTKTYRVTPTINRPWLYQPSCLPASSPLPRGATAIDSYRGIEIWLRISVKYRRGYAVGPWEKVSFNLLLRCVTLTDSLRLLNNMRNARKRESSLASEIICKKVALLVCDIILL